MHKKKKPILFLHVGTHKTGSTFLQTILKFNRFSLIDKGYGYIRMPSDYRCLASKVSDKKIHTIRQDFENIIKQSIYKQCDTFILSWEGFSGNSLSSYHNSEHVAISLKKAFPSFNVKIILYFRRQDEYIQSLYAQVVRGGETRNFQDFLKDFSDGKLSWTRHVGEYIKAFGKESVLAFSYDNIKSQGTAKLAEHFMHTIGINQFNIPHINNIRQLNSGLSTVELEVLRRCNAFLDKKKRLVLRSLLEKQRPKLLKEHYSLFDEHQQKEFIKIYQSDNESLINDFFPEIDKNTFFDVPKNTVGHLSDEIVMRYLIDILIQCEDDKFRKKDVTTFRCLLKRLIFKSLKVLKKTKKMEGLS